MKASKVFRNQPECYVILKAKGEEGEEDKETRYDGYFIDIVSEIVRQGSFIESYDVALFYATDHKSFLKVPLESLQFKE